MVHSENQDERQNKALQKITAEIKVIQEVYNAKDNDAAKRLEALAASGSSIDAGTLIETIN